MQNTLPTKNGEFIESWNEVEFYLNGSSEPVIGGIQSFGYKETADGKIINGSSDDGLMVGQTAGSLKVDGSMTLLSSTWEALSAELGTAKGGFLRAFFNCVINITKSNGVVSSYTIEQMRITGVDNQFKLGPDALTVNITYNARQVKVNGVASFKSTRS